MDVPDPALGQPREDSPLYSRIEQIKLASVGNVHRADDFESELRASGRQPATPREELQDELPGGQNQVVTTATRQEAIVMRQLAWPKRR